MTVEDLIKELEKMPKDLEVLMHFNLGWDGIARVKQLNVKSGRGDGGIAGDTIVHLQRIEYGN